LAGTLYDLYAVYVEIAKQDHTVRRAALYGDQAPPAGHTPFRPLPIEHFEARFEQAQLIPGGEDIFRRQLAKLAQVYQVCKNTHELKNAA